MASENQTISPENRSYLNSLDFDVSKFAQLSALSAMAGIFMGVTAAVIEFQFFSIIFLFPALVGLGIGVFISQGLKFTKTNDLWAVRMAGLIAVIVAVIAMHTTTYLCFQSQHDAETASISQYVEASAEAGVTLFGDRGSRKIHLGYGGMCTYWALQAFVLFVATISMLPDLRRHPFCSECGTWYQKVYLGTATMPTASVASAIKNGQLASIVTGKRTFETTLMNLFQCPVCLDNGATVVGITSVKDREDNDDGDHFDYLEDNIQQRRLKRMVADFTEFFQNRADETDDGLFNISPVETAYLASLFGRDDIEEALLGDVEAVRSELQSMLDSDNSQFTENDDETDNYMKELLERQNAHYNARNG